MYLRKETVVRLETSYKIIMLLGISNEFSAFVNKDRAISVILVDYINDAIRDCIELNLCISDTKRGLKSKNIVKLCNNVLTIIDLMKSRLKVIRDIITTNNKISTMDINFHLANELEFNIKMLYRFISEEANKYDA